MTKIKNIRYIFIFAAIIVLCLCKSQYNILADNIKYIKAQYKHKPINALTYSEYYSEKLFNKIKEDIDYKGEWACAFAMSPSVLQYNKIKTLDGYLSYYPLKYKQTFKKLIEPELIVDKKYADYFNNWAGRAYLFSKEVSFLPVRRMEIENATLRINPEIFKELNGIYIFSRVRILNYKELGFEYINHYTDETSPYKIYLYKIQD